MDKRFIDQMITRAEEFARTGKTQFTKWELLLWHDQQLLSKGIWRSILSNLLAAKPDSRPKILESWGTFIVFDDTLAHDLNTWVENGRIEGPVAVGVGMPNHALAQVEYDDLLAGNDEVEGSFGQH